MTHRAGCAAMNSRQLAVSKQRPKPVQSVHRHQAQGLSRFYFVTAFLLVVVITSVWAVIHGRASDDRPIRAFLQAPEGCSAPCFMGVRLGSTLGNDAQTILQAHAWVQPGSIYVSQDTTRRYMWISWRWSAASPAFLSGNGYMTYSPLDNGRIGDIRVWTTLPYGAVWLALGMPDAGSIGLEHVARYSERWLFTETQLGCGHFWERPTSFYLVAPVVLAAASDGLHVQPYDTVLRARGCTGSKKR